MHTLRLATLLSAVLALACVGCGATNVTLSAAQDTGITVTGSGTATVMPNIAEVNLAVQVTQPTVAAARSMDAAAMDQVRAAVKRDGVADNDVATQAFSISPQFAPGSPVAPPAITGYMVNNEVTIKVRNLDAVSTVLDDAIAAGGNTVRVDGLSFTVDQPDQPRATARDMALADAQQRAAQIAKDTGVTLGKVRAVTDSTDQQVPGPRPLAAAAGASGSTPISPGEQDVTVMVTVTVVYDIR